MDSPRGWRGLGGARAASFVNAGRAAKTFVGASKVASSVETEEVADLFGRLRVIVCKLRLHRRL